MSTKSLKPTKAIAKKILEVVSHGLVRGVGQPIPGQMCVEAAVCFAFGLPHGDNPPCVSSVVRSFKIALNDSQWSSNEARAKGLKRLSIAQLGSDEIDEAIFVKELALFVVRKIVPMAMIAAAKMTPPHSEAILAASKVCEDCVDLQSANAAAEAAAEAAYSARAAAACAAAAYSARAAAACAAYSVDACAADAAACAAAEAANAAACAAAEAANAAARAAAEAANAARDEVLSLMAECAVRALIICKSQGTEWLSLCD